MSKKHFKAGEADRDLVAAVAKKFHKHLVSAKVIVDVLMIHDEDAPGTQVLTHNGYPAAAKMRVVAEKDRAKGHGDAELVIDVAAWEELGAAQQIAVVDHELYHLELALDKFGEVKRDVHRRPRLRCRKHDVHVGWFNEVARRHGNNSVEIRQAYDIYVKHGQTYFAFMGRQVPPSDLAGAPGPAVEMPAEADADASVVDEDTLARSIELIRTTMRCTTSLLQRRLSIGYTMAARIIHVLEERGYIGPEPEKGGARELMPKLLEASAA